MFSNYRFKKETKEVGEKNMGAMGAYMEFSDVCF